jgi:hypothetical protein
MGVNVMRFLALAIAATFLLLPPSAAPAQTVGTDVHAATAAYAEAPAKKHKKHKPAKKEKVEYLRAAPMPPGSK